MLTASLAAIWLWGEKADRRLALWALSVNILPFFLVSLTRYQRSVSQAFVPRYDIFTLIGALLLIGIAWRLLAARLPSRGWAGALGGVILAAMVWGQLSALPIWTAKFLEMSRLSKKCYVVLNQEPPAPQSITPEEFPQVLSRCLSHHHSRPGPGHTAPAGRSPGAVVNIRGFDVFGASLACLSENFFCPARRFS